MPEPCRFGVHECRPPGTACPASEYSATKWPCDPTDLSRLKRIARVLKDQGITVDGAKRKADLRAALDEITAICRGP